jgi:precorrin-2 dehydrogenase/sirohydrochlorin ferrochelatase
MQSYPVCLVGLEHRRVVIVGGGKVALRKAQALLEAGAAVEVISPQFCDQLAIISGKSQSLRLVPRTYQAGDLKQAFLVIAATDSPQINQAVWQEALEEGCLVNVVDDPARSNFILPAVVERGELKIAVSTGGSSPALARRLREQLETEIGPEYGELAALLGELRPELQRCFDPGEPRLKAALRLVDSDLLDILRKQGMQAARQRALALILSFQEASR